MKRPVHIELSSDNIKKITAHFPTKTYKANSTLYYEGQIPISGYLIVIGNIQISKKKKFKKILSSGCIIGVSELINKIPSQISAEVFPNSQICFLDKSTILELCLIVDSELSRLLQNILVGVK